jgi:MFS family permease
MTGNDSDDMTKAYEEVEEAAPAANNMQHQAQRSQQDNAHQPRRTLLSRVYLFTAVFLLFLNFFLAQYDKFVLSYFQAEVIRSLRLSSSDYGILSGYATGIVYALLALPIAFIADYVQARVWVLSVAALWWSLCVLFQGLSRSFWQILLARIGMGIGQAPVEALSISLISDLVDAKWLFLVERYVFIFRLGACGNSYHS